LSTSSKAHITNSHSMSEVLS